MTSLTDDLFHFFILPVAEKAERNIDSKESKTAYYYWNQPMASIAYTVLIDTLNQLSAKRGERQLFNQNILRSHVYQTLQHFTSASTKKKLSSNNSRSSEKATKNISTDIHLSMYKS